MATCTVKLYKVDFTPEMNARVDNLSHYLLIGQRLVLTLNNFQYQQIELNMQLKAVVAERYVAEKYANYLSIYQDGKTYYYFIVGTEWTGQTTVKFTLKMDTINTFADLTFNDKTHVIREHRDRFEPYYKTVWTNLVVTPYVAGNIYGIDNTAPAPTSEFDVSIDSVSAASKATVETSEGKILYETDDNVRAKIRVKSTYMPLLHIYTLEMWVDSYNAGGGLIKSHQLTTYEMTQFGLGQCYVSFKYTASTTIPTQLSSYFRRQRAVVQDGYKRIIDEQSEGLETVSWNENEDEVLTQIVPFIQSTDPEDTTWEDFGNDTWYLSYYTETTYNSSNPDDFIYKNPIRCCLTTDKYQYNYVARKGVTITRAELLTLFNTTGNGILSITFPIDSKGKTLYNSFSLDYPDANNRTSSEVEYDIVNVNDEVIYSGKISIKPLNDRRANGRALVINAGLSFHDYNIKRDNFIGKTNYYLYDADEQVKEINFKNVSQVTVIASGNHSGILDNFYKDQVIYYLSSTNYDSATTSELVTLESFKDVDRTNQKLTKIINIPYCPVNIVDSDLLYDNTYKQLTLSVVESGGTYKGNFDPQFAYTIELNINQNEELENIYTPLSHMFFPILPSDLTLTKTRDDYYESKLYHSDFSYVKFVYDSFGYVFRNELLDTEKIEKDNSTTMNVDYCVSNSMSSAIGFNFDTYYPLKKQYQDYNVLVINRNLEMPIYNNYYLNYLRSGQLATDRKNFTASQVASGIGTGIGIATTVAGVALAATGYGAPFAAPMIVSGVTTIAGSLTSSITNAAKQDRERLQKLENAKNQAAAISGSDDIGLLKWYGNNNLCKLVRYDLNEIAKDRVADLFYYCGYTTDQQKAPNLNSRVWFNFIQCEPVFNESTNPTYKEFIDDVKAKYQAGVTIFHEVLGNMWDFQQVKENWESSLF